MSKFGTFGDYPKESLPSAEAALLTAWRSLDRYHNDLALVGGLTVHYLTTRGAESGIPGAVTMDVDCGISLAASGDQYGTIKSDLAGLDFKTEGNRLVRKFGNLNLYMDFLTEDLPSLTGASRLFHFVLNFVLNFKFQYLNHPISPLCQESGHESS